MGAPSLRLDPKNLAILGLTVFLLIWQSWDSIRHQHDISTIDSPRLFQLRHPDTHNKHNKYYKYYNKQPFT